MLVQLSYIYFDKPEAQSIIIQHTSIEKSFVRVTCSATVLVNDKVLYAVSELNCKHANYAAACRACASKPGEFFTIG